MSLRLPNQVGLVYLMSSPEGHRDASIRRGGLVDDRGEREAELLQAVAGGGTTTHLRPPVEDSSAAFSKDAWSLRPAGGTSLDLPPECYYG